MPQIDVDGLTINYDVQGDGEPLLLIPYLAADHACYAFQLPAYTEHFSCIAVDLPGSGESDKPPGPYSTETYADQLAGFLGAIGIERAHVAGRLPGRGGGDAPRRSASRPRALAVAAQRLGSDRRVPAHDSRVVALARGRAARDRRRGHRGDLPASASRPRCTSSGRLRAGARRLRARPPRPAAGGLLWQTDAVLGHDASQVLGQVRAPTLVTFGAHDLVTSTRFAEPLTERDPGERARGFRPPVTRRAHEAERSTAPRSIPASPQR